MRRERQNLALITLEIMTFILRSMRELLVFLVNVVV